MLVHDLVTLDDPAREPVVLDGAVIVQATFELAGLGREPFLPAGLAATIPTLLTFVVVQVADGPLGALAFAEVRLSCRSGVRARALLVASEVAADEATTARLAAAWGLGGGDGRVVLERRYDRVGVRVPAWGLAVAVADLSPIGVGDIQYVAGLHPVATTGGEERLAQVELDVALERAERGRPVLESYDGVVLGDRRVQPARPVAGTVGVGAVTLPRLRFLLRPDVPPHLGTDLVAEQQTSEERTRRRPSDPPRVSSGP